MPRIIPITLLFGVLAVQMHARPQQTDPDPTDQAPLTPRERALLERVANLEKRLAALEAERPSTAASLAPAAPLTSSSAPVTEAAVASVPATTKDEQSIPGFLAGTTLNFDFDGYYEYNANQPIGRVNLVRAYDPTADNFSVSQAGMVIERTPDAAAGHPFGMRIDLMFGQATETLQGSPLNEPRPQVYRNLYQAYGTYVTPLGKGLTLDFGKFASSLGAEGNYTKDQINYTRSYYFIFLPFYHAGLRATYRWNDKVQLQYWLVNGANATESFNNYKSNAFLLALSPTKNFSWNINYFFGEQGHDVTTDLNPGIPPLSTQAGLSITPTAFPPTGREHIFDTYATWNLGKRWTLVGEGDYVINRQYATSSPQWVVGGAGYIKFLLTSRFSLTDRFEFLSDREGLFSGTSQALKDETFTAMLAPGDGFQVRWEYRIDLSNQPFFLTSQAGILRRDQNTALMGMTWWFGGKQGAW